MYFTNSVLKQSTKLSSAWWFNNVYFLLYILNLAKLISKLRNEIKTIIFLTNFSSIVWLELNIFTKVTCTLHIKFIIFFYRRHWVVTDWHNSLIYSNHCLDCLHTGQVSLSDMSYFKSLTLVNKVLENSPCKICKYEQCFK